MASDASWSQVVLEDLAAIGRNSIVGGPFGSNLLSSDYTPDGVPVIRGENLSGGRWVGGDFVFVSKDKAESLQANLASPRDVIFTQRGANHYRQVAVVPDKPARSYLVSQSQMKVTLDPRKADPLFVYYLFRAPQQQEYLQRNAIQTGVPHTNLSILRKVPLWIPGIDEQRAIAYILGTLDDKIELNRRMSETLEATARALFKSWFVDFDPVRAKAEGRDPGLPKPLADLFPDSFEDSELGGIPKGWGVTQLGEVADTTKGRSYKSSELADSDTALVTLKSFARGGGYRSDGLKSFTGSFKAEQVVSPGEIVVACTDVTQAAEVIGRPAVVAPDLRFDTLVASLDTMIVRARHEGVTRSFLYYLMRTPAFSDHTFAHTTGTTVLHLSRNAVPGFQFASPPRPLIGAFDSFAASSLERIRGARQESATLAALRDALLPKLIDGQLRVAPADILRGCEL